MDAKARTLSLITAKELIVVICETCDRCGKQDLEFYFILVPNKIIGDTSVCDAILPKTKVLEKICRRCFKAIVEQEKCL